MTKIKIITFDQIHDKILVSGTFNNINFDDLEMSLVDFIDYAKEHHPEYCEKYYMEDYFDESLKGDAFDYERFIDELDKKLISDYIVEKDLLSC